MAVRRKERIVLDSLHDLVRHMGAVREGRTAVIAVTDGWLLYGPDPSLRDIRKDDYGHDVDPVPGTPTTPGVGPSGTLTKHVDNDLRPTDRTECEKDQMELSMLNDGKYFQDIFGEANRANVAFTRSIRAVCRSSTRRSARSNRCRRALTPRSCGRGPSRCTPWRSTRTASRS